MDTKSHDQDIDLGQLFSKIGNVYQNILNKIFDIILFIKRKLVVLLVLLVVGFAVGLFLDKTSKSYDHEIIVSPNFGSVDYLYAKIALLDAKKKDRDTLFFNNLGFSKVDQFGKIEIEPVIDVYKFVDKKPDNFDLIKLMAEDGDLEKIVENEITSKNYPFHKIKFSTDENTSRENTIDPLLKFLNDSEYFTTIQKQFIENDQLKMKANDSIIKQIDNLLEGFSKSVASGSRTDKMVYISDNNQLNEIINTKNDLVGEQGSIKLALLNNDFIIKEISTTINSLNTKGINGKRKLILPIMFIVLFVGINVFKSFYKKQIEKRSSL